MKRTSKPQLKVRSLETEALQKVHGGRGTYCGNLIHCDCGYAWVADASNSGACPSCGAATELGGGGGGGGGDGTGGGGGGGGCGDLLSCEQFMC
ncbi:MAG: hypothetical protein IPQ07_24785 [Myxococcales bacterium]|nr:hypothetical protein [Myxococcales bacterium]